MIIEETLDKTKDALTNEVERLNELRENTPMTETDHQLIQEAVNKIGEAFQNLDMIF